MKRRPKILIVDDEPYNVDYLEQELEDLGYETVSAFNGREALEQVVAESPDMILLDIMMPIMDGFEVLERLKAEKRWRDIPVIVISAMDDIASTAKGIELGAEDYLSKPFDPVLLQARLSAGLVKKRLRDQEIEYLKQVELLTNAARAVEQNHFHSDRLNSVAMRGDALGDLARVFQHMAQEVHAREQRLKQQLEQLRLDVEEQIQASQETADVYIPMDRRHSLVSGQPLAERSTGAAVFADISGFTPLTEALARELGRERGAEELVRYLNQVYGAMIDVVHHFGGSVIGFSGDAITCWFKQKVSEVQTALRATACALAMQEAISEFANITTSDGTAVSFAAKVAVAAGPARRLLVGDPRINQIEVLAGGLLDDLSLGERIANRGEIIMQLEMAEQLVDQLHIESWRSDLDSGKRFALVGGLRVAVPPTPWPKLPAAAISPDQARAWLLPPVYEQVLSGRSHFLAELRVATALFLSFAGLDYDEDDLVGKKLDDFVRWVQVVLQRHSGYLIQLTTGDKGSYLYASFGAPVKLVEEKVRTLDAALDLLTPPPGLDFIKDIKIGVAAGLMRVGAYGSVSHRTYGVMSEKANLAARLMQVAHEGVLCDESVYQATRDRFNFKILSPISLKGIVEPVAVYLPSRLPIDADGADQVTTKVEKRSELYSQSTTEAVRDRFDRLTTGQLLTLKVASVIGSLFDLTLLQAVYPVEADRQNLLENLRLLEGCGLILQVASAPVDTFEFVDNAIQNTAYDLLLYAQRRQLHRAIAEWYENGNDVGSAENYPLLAHHWGKAEDMAKTIFYLEKAGEAARKSGDLQGAQRFFNQALSLDAEAAVLSSDFNFSGQSEDVGMAGISGDEDEDILPDY